MLVKAEIGGLKEGNKEIQASNSPQDCKNTHKTSMESGSEGNRVDADGVDSTNEVLRTENVECEELWGNNDVTCGGLSCKEGENNTERLSGGSTCKSREEEEVENKQEIEKEVENLTPVVQRCQVTLEPDPENAQQDAQPAVGSAKAVATFRPI